ncbi:MAG: peptidase [Conexibacter sp.]|nr:peptidase [Conexibacter sp.]
MLIVDAHLDLAYNALNGREVTRRAAEQTPQFGDGTPSVGLPDLRFGGVDLICATIFCEPDKGGGSAANGKCYRTGDEARAQAQRQLQWYYKQVADGLLDLVTDPARLNAGGPPTGRLSAILLMEGADPLRSPAEVAEWFDAGLRIVGLAWKGTRLAGGTGEPGPLTAEGRALVRALDHHRIIHDTSHLAEESFWELLDGSAGPVMASHSNCRSIVPTDRQLSDDMIRAIGKRGGIIGINFFDKFLLRPSEYKTRPARLADVIDHLKHMCDLIGDAAHVGIGTDMDGGFGREQIPEEIRTSADMPKMADALAAAGFNAADVAGIMGGNWLRFFRKNLPGG